MITTDCADCVILENMLPIKKSLGIISEYEMKQLFGEPIAILNEERAKNLYIINVFTRLIENEIKIIPPQDDSGNIRLCVPENRYSLIAITVYMEENTCHINLWNKEFFPKTMVVDGSALSDYKQETIVNIEQKDTADVKSAAQRERIISELIGDQMLGAELEEICGNEHSGSFSFVSSAAAAEQSDTEEDDDDGIIWTSYHAPKFKPFGLVNEDRRSPLMQCLAETFYRFFNLCLCLCRSKSEPDESYDATIMTRGTTGKLLQQALLKDSESKDVNVHGYHYIPSSSIMFKRQNESQDYSEEEGDDEIIPPKHSSPTPSSP